MVFFITHCGDSAGNQPATAAFLGERSRIAMLERVLADLVLGLHALFILFVVGGGGFVYRQPKLVWLHVPAAIWGAYVECSASLCPLTIVENHFRHLAGQAGYPGSFIEHYLMPVIYPPGLTADIQVVLGAAVVAVNVVFYTLLVRRWWGTGRMGGNPESG
jgi:hypothetical protein